MEKVARQESVVVDSIIDALVSLMHQKPVDQITISELANRAGVGRVTFYRNFEDKDDVLRRHGHRVTDEFLARTGINYTTATSAEEYVRVLFQHLYDNREMAALFERDNRMYIVEEEFDRAFHAHLDPVADEFRVAFVVGGFYRLYRHWAATGYQRSVNEIAAMAAEEFMGIW